jgi:hypothetical protein
VSPYLLDVPLAGGGRLRVEGTDLPGDLELAAARPGQMAVKARETLERSLDEVAPAAEAILRRLGATGPDEISVEFGLVLSAEAGMVVAKGSSEVHFAVSLVWRRPPQA